MTHLYHLGKGLSKEGLFDFCGIFPTHPALAAAHISPDPLNHARPALTRSEARKAPNINYFRPYLYRLPVVASRNSTENERRHDQPKTLKIIGEKVLTTKYS